MTEFSVPAESLSTRGLLLLVLQKVLDVQSSVTTLTRSDTHLETLMADQATALAELQSAVDNLVAAEAAVPALQAALKATQDALATMTSDDEQVRADAQEAAAKAVADAQAAADAIEAQVSRITQVTGDLSGDAAPATPAVPPPGVTARVDTDVTGATTTQVLS